MRKIPVLISLFIFLAAAVPQRAQAMDPKVKAFLLVSTYGTIGGGLLGLSSMAFGGEGRNVWKGMSIGLYLGMAFGGYIVASHKYKLYKARNPDPQTPYYDDAVTPYEEENSSPWGFDGGGGGGPSDAYEDNPEEAPPQRMQTLRLDISLEEKFELKRDRKNLPLYLHLLDYRF